MLKIITLVLCWIGILSVGAYLRFDQLSKRPFHADEATGARITSARMESGDYRFDPSHYHGPLLSSLAIPICTLRGENRWQDLSKSSLRLLPAIAGTLLLLIPLLGRRRFGDAPMLLAAALLASSPLLVYYSRMFIHEMLLVSFGMAAIFFLTRRPVHLLPGLLVGLMFATKESFAISMLAWTAVGALVAWENRKSLDSTKCLSFWKTSRSAILSSLLAAALISIFCYTDGFQRPEGAIDAVRTFFVYETVAGHEKPFAYYLQLIALPSKSGGLWWFGTPVLILATFSFLSSFREKNSNNPTIRFLAYAAAGHFLIYSLFGYKTPWLACLPWAHVCLLAGFAIAGFPRHGLPVKTALALLVGITVTTQLIQARNATGRFDSDDRNPFAYVPTRRDVETLEAWLDKLRLSHPSGSLEPIAVIGSDYWPLPWYLRSFEKIGYWTEPPQNIASMPVVFAMPETAAATSVLLETTHISLPRGLRSGVPIQVFLRNDLWERWMKSGN